MSDNTPSTDITHATDETANDTQQNQSSSNWRDWQPHRQSWRNRSSGLRHLLTATKFFGDHLGLIFVVCALVYTHLNTEQRQQDKAALDKLYSGVFHHTPPSFNTRTIALENQHYLKQAEKEAVEDLLKLSAISAALDVVSSSQVGVSFIAEFNVTLGHALNELNRGIKRALEVNMLSVAAIKVLGIIARAGEHTHHILIFLCLWSWLFYFLFDMASEHVKVPASVIRQMRVLSGRFLIVFVTFYLLLPYSIHVSALVSQQLHTKMREDNRTKLDNLHGSLIIKEDAHDASKNSFKHKARSSINHLSQAQTKGIHQKVESLFSYLLISLTITLFDLIIMPVVILYGLYRICRQVLVIDDKLTTNKVIP
jgi:hypothetical protein